MTDGRLPVELFAVLAFGAWIFVKLVLPRLARAKAPSGPKPEAAVRVLAPPAPIPRVHPPMEVRARERRPPAAEFDAPRARTAELRAAMIALEVFGPPRALR